MGLGAASIEWTGLARLGAGAVWAASATVKLNIAAQQNSRRELAMKLKVKTKPVYLAEQCDFATGSECAAVATLLNSGEHTRPRVCAIASTRGACAPQKLTTPLLLRQHCAAVNP